MVDAPQLIERTLDNGLRIAIQPDPASPVVGIALYYDVGSRNEVPGMSGFAHLFEHMMFQGSANVGKAEHFTHITGWGGEVNGTTSQDRTNYYQSLPAHQLALGLWLEADRMRSLAVTPENFENQRQTVMEERRQRVDNSPYGEAVVRLGELSFDCWAYAHPIIGYWDDLENARLDDVVGFHRRWYRPDNAVLALTGDVDPGEALDLVERWFGDIEAGGPRPAPDLRQGPRAAPVEQRVDDGLAKLPAVCVNLRAPNFTDPDFYIYEVLETLLYRGTSSRLYRRLVIEEQCAVQVSGGYEAHRGPSLLSLFAAAPAGGDLNQIRDSFLDELQRLAREPVPAQQLEKAITQLRAARVFARQSVLARALDLGQAVLYHDDARWDDRYLDRVRAVTADDLLRVAARDFNPDHRVVLKIHPK